MGSCHERVGLTCHCLGEKSLSCSRRTNQQCAFWNLAAKIGVALRTLEEVDNLGNFGLGLGKTCHVFKRDLGLVVLVEKLGFRFANAEYASTAATTGHASCHPEPEED